MRTRILVVLIAATQLLACGSDAKAPTSYTPENTPELPNNPGTPAPDDPDDQILVQDNFFSPGSATVPAGTTVTWTWVGGYTAHSVTFNDGVGSSTTQATGTHQRTFSTPGTYPYHCSVHGTAMSGTVTVTE